MLEPLVKSLVAAVIPTILYVYVIWWCDRYEREPGWLLLTTFVWGAIPAIILSLAAELLIQQPLEPLTPEAAGNLVQVALVSPLVEEVAKALALAGLFVFIRDEIDDVLDGIVYGALVGVGFAMSENFFYFLQSANGAGDNLVALTVVRAFVFGLNHAYYTAITGAFFGYAALKRKRWKRYVYPLIGLALATIAHVLHNVTTALSSGFPAMFLLSVMLSWGGILLFAAIIFLALRQEDLWIKTQLIDEVPKFLSEAHYELVKTHPRRFVRVRLLWRGKNREQARLEAELKRVATELAFRKHRLAELGPRAEPKLRPEIIRLRYEVAALNRALILGEMDQS